MIYLLRLDIILIIIFFIINALFSFSTFFFRNFILDMKIFEV